MPTASWYCTRARSSTRSISARATRTGRTSPSPSPSRSLARWRRRSQRKGKLDPEALVVKYVPELKDSAYGDATVRQVMDMTIGVKYSENYTDPKAEVFDYARAGGMVPQPPDYTGPKTFFEFLVTLQKEGEHDAAFAYKTSNAEVLAWIVKHSSGQSMADLLSQQIWQKLGAENDAYFMIDSIGTEGGGGGLNTTLRDLARFGEVIRNKGRFNGQQIVPAEAV